MSHNINTFIYIATKHISRPNWFTKVKEKFSVLISCYIEMYSVSWFVDYKDIEEAFLEGAKFAFAYSETSNNKQKKVRNDYDN